MKRPTHVLSVLALLVVAAGAHADSLNGLRSSVARVGDVNGDGVPDLAVASRDRDRPERVWILSGKDGLKLRELSGRPISSPADVGPSKLPVALPGERFGAEIGPVGDWDRDGKPDLYVAARDRRPRRGSGYRQLISGTTGAVMLELDGAGAVGGTRDLDGDGLVDLLLELGPRERNEAGRFVVLSGKDRTELLSVAVDSDEAPGEAPTVASLTWIGDVDRDGRCDFAAALSIWSREEKSSQAAVEFGVRSGRTGLALWTAPIDREEAGAVVRLSDANADGIDDVLCVLEDRSVRLLGGQGGATIWKGDLPRHVLYSLGSSFDAVGDVDHDGVEDWVIAANESCGAFFDAGFCQLLSGKTGEIIRALPEDENFGFDACGLGDVNGDGVPDFAVGAERQRGWTPDDSSEPAVQLRSGKDASILWMRRHVDLRR